MSLKQCCDKLAVYSAGGGSNGRCAAVEAGDLTQVSMGSLWLQPGGEGGCEGIGSIQAGGCLYNLGECEGPGTGLWR